ncbi:MAG: SGNH/GDSL hydrolase family protein [Clostridia bacterium]|nr:SGNH/GDSL hydrolase family protein [Clostridia bacterium]
MKKTLTVILITAILISTCTLFTINSNSANKTYLVFGDSIAAGYGVTENWSVNTTLNSYVAGKNSNAYCGIVSRDLNLDLINLAKSGATTTDMLNLLKSNNVKSQIKNADLITVSIGGNDLIGMVSQVLISASIYEFMKSIGIPVSRTTTEIEQMYSKLESNLTSIMKTIKDNSKNGSVIMLQTLYNPYKASPSYSLDYYGKTFTVGDLIDYYIDRVNDIYKKVQQNVGGFYLCQTAEVMNSDYKCFNEVSNPDFHPTNYGHKVIAETIKMTYNSIINNPIVTEATTTTTTAKPIETTVVTTTQTQETQSIVETRPPLETDIEVITLETTEATIETSQTTLESSTSTTTETTSVTTIVTSTETTTFEITTIEETSTIIEETSVTTIETTSTKEEYTSTEITQVATTYTSETTTEITTVESSQSTVSTTENQSNTNKKNGCKSYIGTAGLIFTSIVSLIVATALRKEH